jgi:hypothetical protein
MRVGGVLAHSALAIDMMKDGDKAKDLAALRVFVPPQTTLLYRVHSGT